MNRQQAINYLLSSGFSEEQINTIEQAFKQEPTTKNDLAVAEMIKLVRESDVIDRTDGSELAKAFNYLFDRYIEEPTTKNDLGVDCISRDEACRYVAEFVNHEFSTREEEELIDNIITGIEHLPSVTPQEPRKGHWILTEDDFVYCSECEDSYYPRPIDASWYYCPHCGCCMVEPQADKEQEQCITTKL